MLKKFRDLTEKEILALAISSEEEDGRIYGEFADALARVLSGHSADVRRNARGRGGASRPADRDVPAAIWRSHSADPPRKREGIFAAQADVADAAAGRERGAEAGAR